MPFLRHYSYTTNIWSYTKYKPFFFFFSNIDNWRCVWYIIKKKQQQKNSENKKISLCNVVDTAMAKYRKNVE